jgi:hypothetical protein
VIPVVPASIERMDINYRLAKLRKGLSVRYKTRCRNVTA